MNPNVPSEVVLLLTEAQPRLFGFLLKRLARHDQAHDVLQEVNLVVCQRANEFEPGTDFMAWTFAIARFQIMAFRKRQSRDRLVFPQDIAAAIDSLDTQLFPHAAETDREDALRECVKSLTPQHRELLLRRYAEAISVKALAAEMGKTANAVSIILHRIREQLSQCIEFRLSGEQAK